MSTNVGVGHPIGVEPCIIRDSSHLQRAIPHGMERFLEFQKKNDTTEALSLLFGDRSITSGDYIPRSEAASAPRISYAAKSPTAKYIVICLDFDAPFPGLPFLSPILHWIQSDLQAPGLADTLTTTAPFISNYVGPQPPSASSAHRYVFFLYEQPANFNYKDHAPPGGQEMGIWARVRWDLTTWERDAMLEHPVAMGFFTTK